MHELAQLPVGLIESEPPSPPIAAAAEWQPPQHWSLVDPAHGNRHLMLLDHVKHSRELAEIKAHWQSTGGYGVILSVHRIQNPALHQRYEEAKQRLQQSGEQHQADATAYHGTRLNDPALIYDSPTGFDVSKGTALAGSVSCCAGEAVCCQLQSSSRAVLSLCHCLLIRYLWTAVRAHTSCGGYQHGVRTLQKPVALLAC